MPGYVVQKVSDALNEDSKSVRGSRVLVLGIAYKKDIDDLRESPALEVIRLLQEKGATVQYHDPFCPVIADDGHTALHNLPLHSQPFTEQTLRSADVVVLITDHTDVDYEKVAAEASLVVDTRGTMRGLAGSARVIGLSGRELANAPSLLNRVEGDREATPVIS
jgi:UDP-N-acetyl-D-glucosamine dehydrogenase